MANGILVLLEVVAYSFKTFNKVLKHMATHLKLAHKDKF
jgi:hypothetical protein